MLYELALQLFYRGFNHSCAIRQRCLYVNAGISSEHFNLSSELFFAFCLKIFTIL